MPKDAWRKWWGSVEEATLGLARNPRQASWEIGTESNFEGRRVFCVEGSTGKRTEVKGNVFGGLGESKRQDSLRRS